MTYGERTIDNAVQSVTEVFTRGRPTRPVVLEDLQDFMQRIRDQPPLTWRVPGLIPDEGICLWHGQPRDFKTLTAQAVALALAAGYDAFGSERFHIARPVKVAYFTEEDPERLFGARMHWLTQKNPEPGRGYFFPFVRKSLSFDVEEDRDFILRTLQECGAEVAIFDPVRSYTCFSDKGPAELRPVTVFLREIQNTTAAKTLVLVHHDTKPPTKGEDERSRSQQASGGGIFSISDCPVSFTKLDWNCVGVRPEDYKLSGDPKPFEITFETDAREGEHGLQFGTWITPLAVTKNEQDILHGVAAKKILAFLGSSIGAWHTTKEVNEGAHIRKDSAGAVLEKLRVAGRVLFCTGAEAKALGRSEKAHLWSGVKPEARQQTLMDDEGM
jgi:hypothetical protein